MHVQAVDLWDRNIGSCLPGSRCSCISALRPTKVTLSTVFVQWPRGTPARKAERKPTQSATMGMEKRLVPVRARAIGASITKTQSPSPALFLPGGLNCLLPVFANGEPLTSVYSPFVGSYQRAVDMAVSFDMSTVIRRIDGMYAITKEPSEVRAAVRQV